MRAGVASIPRKKSVYSRMTGVRRQIPWTRHGNKGNVVLKSRLKIKSGITDSFFLLCSAGGGLLDGSVCLCIAGMPEVASLWGTPVEEG